MEGRELMAKLKSYTCSKCAGTLTFDSDQEFFDCPFCGNKFDIVDFHADEVLDQAKSLLEQKAFDAAKEKFDLMLDNDPHNFDALLGSVLCVMKLSSTEDLEDRANLGNCDLVQAKKALTNARKNSVGDKADYFAKFISSIENHEKLVKLEKEKQKLSSGYTREELNDQMIANFQQFRTKERESLPWGLIITCSVIIIAVFISLAVASGDIVTVGFRIFFVLIAIIVLIVGVTNQDEEHDANYNPVERYEESLNYKIEERQKNYKRALLKMKKLLASPAREEEEPQIASESAPAAEADIDASQNITCAKCGAGLLLDKEKRVYQCDHCGVAYGISLFFGLPMEKALNALNTGYYRDADQRFSNLLMVDSSDFEALLGRVLSAGRWTKVSGIKLSSDLEEKELEAVMARLEEAGRGASEKDKPFFRKMEELISLFKPYQENKKELDLLNDAVADMEIKADVYAIAFAGANYGEEYKTERQKLVSKTYPVQVNLKKLEEQFSGVQKELTELRDGCRLV